MSKTRPCSYVQVIFLIGLGAYLYTEVFSRFLNKSLPCQVSAIRRLNGNTTEVTLTPKGQKLRHQPGQFLFVRFPRDRALDEAHPFTISSAPGESDIRLSIKASGDFTRSLYQQLSEGAEALVEGAYGLFQYQNGGPKQIWIAGGIGITPFLSFLRRGAINREVDFYYTVRTREEALFLDEIENALRVTSPRGVFGYFFLALCLLGLAWQRGGVGFGQVSHPKWGGARQC